jgi:hypothetical protein
MIARVWTARATRQGAIDYATFFKSYWLPKLSLFAGYRGITMQTREVDGVVQIILTTFWDSTEASLAFGATGSEEGVKRALDDAATVPEDAAKCLIDYDPSVVHYEVVVDCFPNAAKP